MATDIADSVQELVAKAFVLEALTDKPGCTTRHQDLPGKPLQDFVIAGINSSNAFQLFADSFSKNPKTPIFGYNLQALKVANIHKSKKYINFGLLEIMFPTVAARLSTDNQEEVVDKIVELIQQTTKDDLNFILETRELAWSTSTTSHKVGFVSGKYKSLESVWDFYMKINQEYPPENSNFQWTEEYKKGLPTLRAFFDEYTKNRELMATTRKVFDKQRRENPAIAIGIVADMCAAAIFLWLSFNKKPVK